MKTEFRHEPLARLSTPALVAYSFEEAPSSSGTVEQLPLEVRNLLRQLQTAGELTGKAFECTPLGWPPGMAAAKLLVVGAGKREKFSERHLGHLAGTAVRYLRSRGRARDGLDSGLHRSRRGDRRCGWRSGGRL